MSIDWDSILGEQDEDTGGFEVLPPGKYPVKVIEREVVKASTGSSMIKVVSKITEGPYENRQLWTNLVFKLDSKGATRMLILKLNGLGVTKEWLSTNAADIHDIAKKLDGAAAIADVGQSVWEGQTRNEVKMFHPIGGGRSVPTPVSAPDAVPPAPDISGFEKPVSSGDDDFPDPF